MWIALMRHGDAVDYSDAGNDEARWLTALGRAKSMASARELTQPTIQRIYTSPFVRAVQTSEIAANALGYSESVRVIDALVPDGSPLSVLQGFGDRGEHDAVLLVGHEPSMHRIAATLLSQPDFRPFDKSEICVLHCPPGGKPALAFSIHPERGKKIPNK